MTKLGIVGAMILAAAGAAGGGDVWAADIFPIEALSASAASNPKVCTGLWDFITTSCELSWQGITIYLARLTGVVGWQSHSAPLDLRSAPGASYLIEKINRSSRWSLAPNALSTSTIGIKGTEPIGGTFSAVFAVDAGFDPYSLRLSNGPGSLAANAGVPLNQQTADRDFSRAGQWYNGEGYVGVNSSTYGTLTVFRQYALSRDAAYDYDPLSGSYAFSPIKGETCGGGNTENCRHSTSLKYRIGLGHLRRRCGSSVVTPRTTPPMVHISSKSVPTSRPRAKVRSRSTQFTAMSEMQCRSRLGQEAPMPMGSRYRRSCRRRSQPPSRTTTRCCCWPNIPFNGSSSTRATNELRTWPRAIRRSFTDIAGSLVCENCTAINNTNIVNTAFGRNGFGNKILQVMWTGVRYAVTDKLDVITAYYHYTQNSYYGTPTAGPLPCSGRRALAMRRYV